MRKLITSLLLTIVTIGYSQFKKGEGVAIRFSKELITSYSIYETPASASILLVTVRVRKECKGKEDIEKIW